MAEYSAPCTLVTPGPDITFNATSGDTYMLDPASCSGLDQAPLRTPYDDNPQAAGAILHDFLKAGRPVALGGHLINTTGTAAARNTLEANLIAALEAIETADGTFTITPSGMTAKVLTVRCLVPVTFAGAWHKTFLFTLIAADPVFT